MHYGLPSIQRHSLTFLAALAVAITMAAGCGSQDRQQSPASEQAARATASEQAAGASGNPLLNPKLPDMNQQAPDKYQARFNTSKGDFVIEVVREWAPNGADRFYNLVRNGFYDDARFFRVISGFMAQFGIHADPKVSSVWREAPIPDDPVRQSNTRGTVSFATAGPNTRTTQLFVNLVDNTRLDGMGFSPFGKVVEGMDVVDSLHAGYGEGAPRGRGPDQGRIQSQGNEYLKSEFPQLDYINTARIVE
jgi:peptidyl-prolyl cis-trans isomerase A (cyclophilin A)